MSSASSKFSFMDEGEAVRRLGVDRDTLTQFVQEKRLRAYPGAGKGSNFFRAADVEKLATELRGEEQQEAQAASASGRKLFDPAYKVHVRLQADLKWYDLEDDDLKAWAREMTPDGYARQRTNIQQVIDKLQRMLQLMDEAAANWKSAPSQPPIMPTKRPRKSLPMANQPPPPAGEPEA